MSQEFTVGAGDSNEEVVDTNGRGEDYLFTVNKSEPLRVASERQQPQAGYELHKWQRGIIHVPPHEQVDLYGTGGSPSSIEMVWAGYNDMEDGERLSVTSFDSDVTHLMQKNGDIINPATQALEGALATNDTDVLVTEVDRWGDTAQTGFDWHTLLSGGGATEQLRSDVENWNAGTLTVTDDGAFNVAEIGGQAQSAVDVADRIDNISDSTSQGAATSRMLTGVTHIDGTPVHSESDDYDNDTKFESAIGVSLADFGGTTQTGFDWDTMRQGGQDSDRLSVSKGGWVEGSTTIGADGSHTVSVRLSDGFRGCGEIQFIVDADTNHDMQLQILDSGGNQIGGDEELLAGGSGTRRGFDRIQGPEFDIVFNDTSSSQVNISWSVHGVR